MKQLPFVKMHGTGNDFIMIHENDLAKLDIILWEELIKQMCDRHFWIWSDGIVVIASWEKVPYKYLMYNPDGSQAEMCWNGIRCYMKYLIDRWYTTKDQIKVETWIGVLTLKSEFNRITVDMWKPWKIKNLVYESKKLWDRFPLKIDKAEFIFTPVSMGNPHAVIYCKDVKNCWMDLQTFDIKRYGWTIEHHTDIFPNKTNVEFAKIISETEIQMRVWERWVWETLACGTGACAAVVSWILSGKLLSDTFIKVNLAWGILEVKWSGDKKDSVIMRWDAQEVFEGIYYLNM